MINKSGNVLGAVLAAALAATVLGGCAGTSTNTPAADGTQGAPTGTPTGNLVVLPSAPTTAASAPTTAAQPTGGSNGGGAAGVPQCTTVDLSGEANVVAGSAATGHITMNITVTNTSGHTCSIYGFPGLKLEDKNQNSQSTAVTWDPAIPKTLITLTNNQSASSSARYDKDLPVGSEPLMGPCEAASYYLQITAPNNTTQLVVQIGDTGGVGITVCDFGALDVLAFVPGSVGPHE